MADPQGPPQQPAYPSANPHQPEGQAGYPGAQSGPPAYVYGQLVPGSASHGQPQLMVVMVGNPQAVLVVQPPSVSMIGAITLSCVTFWFCGGVIGLIAFVVAMVGWSKSSDGNVQIATQLRNASYGISIFGIIVGIVVGTVVGILIITHKIDVRFFTQTHV